MKKLIVVASSIAKLARHSRWRAATCLPMVTAFQALPSQLLRPFFMFVLFVLLAVRAQATIYYVDSTNGSDSNNGTSTSTPWQSLTKANAVSLLPGDQLLFIYGGVWSGALTIQHGGTATSPVIVGAYGNASNPKPTINAGGAHTTALLVKGSINYVTVENLAVTNFDGANITDGVEGNRTGMLIGQYGDTETGINILNNEIYYVEGYSNSPSVGSPRGTSLDPNTYNQYGCAALWVRGNQMNNLTISGNYIHDCTGEGLWVQPQIANTGANGLLVEDNSIQNVGLDGIVVENAASPVVEYNSCVGAGNNSNGGTWPVAGYIGFHGLAAAGMWAIGCSNSLFQYNYCQGTHQILYDGQPWDFDLALTGTCIYQYNYSVGNEGGFLLSTGTTSGLTKICRFNISVNDGSKQGNGEGFFNQDCESYNNNIFYRTDGKGFLMPSSVKGTFDNNIFYTTATTNITYQTSTAHFNNNCFYGHTPVAPGTSPVLANPLFVDATTAAAGRAWEDEGGFALQSGSPCIGAGVAIANNGGQDYWGNALAPSSMNIGASANSPETILYVSNPSGVTLTGSWSQSTFVPGYYGAYYIYNSNTGSNSVQFTPDLPTAGSYQVSAWWTTGSTRATNTPFSIVSTTGTTSVQENQQINGGQWVSLGTYSFNAGTDGSVKVSNTGANGDVIANAVKFSPVSPVILDVSDSTGVTITGSWTQSTGVPGYYGNYYLYNSNTGSNSVKFTPNLPSTGTYQVFAWWTTYSNRATNTPFSIVSASGTTPVQVNQQINGGQWVSLGTYSFNAGTGGSVSVSNTGANGDVIANAVEFVPQ